MRIGRSIATAIATHSGIKTDVHGVGEDYLAKTGQIDQTISDAEIPDAITRDTELVTHQEITDAHHGRYVDAEAVAVVGGTIAIGQYTGNGAETRQITVGFAPSLVIITSNISASQYVWIVGLLAGCMRIGGLTITNLSTDAKLHAEDGFIVDGLDAANVDPYVYTYLAVDRTGI